MGKRRSFGNLQQLSSGRWQARYKLDGVFRNAPETFATEDEGDEWLNDRETALRGAVSMGDKLNGDCTFNEWADGFLRLPRKKRKRTDSHTTSKKAHRTIENYESTLRLHVRPFLGSMRVSDITLQTVFEFQEWIEDKLEEKRTTNEKAQNYAKWVLNYALSLEAITRNPYAHPEVVMPDGSFRREPVPVEHDQIVALGESMRHPQYKLVPVFTSYTGLRAGEVWGLRRSNVNLLRKRIEVTHSVGEVKGKGMVMGPPKNGRSRTVPIVNHLATELEAYMDTFPGKPDDFLFRTLNGKQVRHHNFMEDVWKQAKVKAELPSALRFHDLRHHAAHFFISAGVRDYGIMQLMGHSSIKITMDIYGGLIEAARESFQEAASEYLETIISALPAQDVVTQPVMLSSIESNREAM